MTEMIRILEIIGTIAFALSGALVAVEANLDIFGVTFIACITAFGGGMFRDMLLGRTPPAIFDDFPMFALAMAVALICFIVMYIFNKHFDSFKQNIENVNNVFDAIGLSAFVAIGCEIGYTSGFSHNAFIVVSMGMFTGVGGGILRDVLINTTPYIFKKHIYATAAIFGGIVYFIIREWTQSTDIASVTAMFLIFTIRMLATKFRWSLPKVKR